MIDSSEKLALEERIITGANKMMAELNAVEFILNRHHYAPSEEISNNLKELRQNLLSYKNLLSIQN